MRKRIEYTDEPLEMEVVKDFLPPPEELVLKEATVKVTISLSKSSVDFFKTRGRRYRTPYQKMIRRVLDLYVAHHK